MKTPGRVVFNELSLSPGGATHDIAPADAHHIQPAVEEYIHQTSAHDGGSAVSAAAGDRSDSPILIARRAPGRDRMERALRTVLKPLIALATARYLLVTALAALTALIVASEAGKVINAKLEPVITALKRF
jgi:hypothetical protein